MTKRRIVCNLMDGKRVCKLLKEPKKIGKNKRECVKNGIGLALGGGGVRACMHIGFYEILLEHNVPISCVAGTSMGAVVGSGIAMGYSPEQIKQSIVAFGKKKPFTWRHFNYFNGSIFKRDTLDDILKDALKEHTFEDTKIPFACTSVDLESTKEIIFEEGLLWKAVAASTAYPPLFPPVYYKDAYLVDGGVLDNVPGLVARGMGAKNLVAIMINTNMLREIIAGKVYLRHIAGPLNKVNWYKRWKANVVLTLEILLQTINVAVDPNTYARLEKANPELFIEEFVNYDLMDFDKIDEIIERGRELGRKHIITILKMVKGIGEDEEMQINFHVRETKKKNKKVTK